MPFSASLSPASLGANIASPMAIAIAVLVASIVIATTVGVFAMYDEIKKQLRERAEMNAGREKRKGLKDDADDPFPENALRPSLHRIPEPSAQPAQSAQARATEKPREATPAPTETLKEEDFTAPHEPQPQKRANTDEVTPAPDKG